MRMDKYTITTTAIVKSVWEVEARNKSDARKKLIKGEAEPINEDVENVRVDVIRVKQASPAK